MTESLGHDVGLVAAGVQPKLAFVVVGLAVAAANRDSWRVLGTTKWTDALRTTYASGAGLGAVGTCVTLELVAARWYRQYCVS